MRVAHAKWVLSGSECARICMLLLQHVTTVFSAGMRHDITIYPAEFWLTPSFSTPPSCAHPFFRHVPVCQRTCSTQHLPLGSLICNDGGHSFQDYMSEWVQLESELMLSSIIKNSQSFSSEVTQTRTSPTLTLCNLRKQTAAVRRGKCLTW